MGTAYPNGKVYIKDLDMNLIDSYNDKKGDRVNPNPVILDYAAEADIYLKNDYGVIQLYDYKDMIIYSKPLNEFDD